jgi:glycosyltransferase involved in cell wall biosynthesis
MKLISVVSPCYNEEENVAILIERVRAVFAEFPQYEYEHILIDNHSTDSTVEVLRAISVTDPHVRVIVNARNFGQIRSPQHVMMTAKGDAVILLFSDLQDPPELLAQMIRKWEEGYLIVACIKSASEENGLMYFLRTSYYKLVERLTDVQVMQHFTGFGLYDRKVMEEVRKFDDPYPYFRGQIAETGMLHYELHYKQGRRERGITKNNFYTLYDHAMLGITNLSKVPLRAVIFFGFVCAVLSLVAGFCYLIAKLLFWNSFQMGLAPTMIGLFFLGSVQLVSLGIIGEYVGSIHTVVQKRPFVTEKERINF